MHRPFAARYAAALEQTRELLAHFGARFSPISMASSAETGALLAALAAVLDGHARIEGGSGFTSGILAGGMHVESNLEYAARVREWMSSRSIPHGKFYDHDHLNELHLEGPLLFFLDDDLSKRLDTFAWLQGKLERAVVLVDDAQPGGFEAVQEVVDRLRADPRGRLIDCADWTRDGWGREATLWVGSASQFPETLAEELAAGPPRPLPEPPNRLLLCINDTADNARWECTVRALSSIGVTVDLQRDSLWIVDNGSNCPISRQFLDKWTRDQLARGGKVRVFRLPNNGYATYAFNRLLAMVPDGEIVFRLENDIEFLTNDWPRIMARALTESGFGLLSAKPLDLPALARDVPLSEVAGVRLQEVAQVPGFCTAFAPQLRLQLGALASAGRYIEDLLTSERARALGFRAAYIDAAAVRCYHVDHVASPGYHQWKRATAEEEVPVARRMMADWAEHRRSPFEPFDWVADGFHEVLPAR